MFSSIFGKRRTTPAEDSLPPIPGAKVDDGFVVIPGGNSLYPNVSDPSPYPMRPAPPTPVARASSTEKHFNYLNGVPFSMSKQLQLVSKKDTFAVEIGDLLAFATNRINLEKYDYDFSIEKSVLREC